MITIEECEKSKAKLLEKVSKQLEKQTESAQRDRIEARQKSVSSPPKKESIANRIEKRQNASPSKKKKKQRPVKYSPKKIPVFFFFLIAIVAAADVLFGSILASEPLHVERMNIVRVHELSHMRSPPFNYCVCSLFGHSKINRGHVSTVYGNCVLAMRIGQRSPDTSLR